MTDQDPIPHRLNRADSHDIIQTLVAQMHQKSSAIFETLPPPPRDHIWVMEISDTEVDLDGDPPPTFVMHWKPVLQRVRPE